jgi:hypothetical protein
MKTCELTIRVSRGREVSPRIQLLLDLSMEGAGDEEALASAQELRKGVRELLSRIYGPYIQIVEAEAWTEEGPSDLTPG